MNKILKSDIDFLNAVLNKIFTITTDENSDTVKIPLSEFDELTGNINKYGLFALMNYKININNGKNFSTITLFPTVKVENDFVILKTIYSIKEMKQLFSKKEP